MVAMAAAAAGAAAAVSEPGVAPVSADGVTTAVAPGATVDALVAGWANRLGVAPVWSTWPPGPAGPVLPVCWRQPSGNHPPAAHAPPRPRAARGRATGHKNGGGVGIWAANTPPNRGPCCLSAAPAGCPPWSRRPRPPARPALPLRQAVASWPTRPFRRPRRRRQSAPSRPMAEVPPSSRGRRRGRRWQRRRPATSGPRWRWTWRRAPWRASLATR